MAANKFATMLHRNTNKITLILIYAVLEWILIVLLLLNSLFSYLIIKFAEYFGLSPPCLWCSRVDHLLEPTKNMRRDLLCEAHSKEISNLGFCSNHQKLAESQDMCEDCLSSRPEFKGLPKNVTLLKEFGMIQSVDDHDDDREKKCSCCGVSLDDNNSMCSSYIVIKPSWGLLGVAQKGNLIAENCEDQNKLLDGYNSDSERSDFGTDFCKNEHEIENMNDDVQILPDSVPSEKIEAAGESGSVSVKEVEVEEDKRESVTMKDQSVQVCIDQGVCIETPPQHLEFFVDFSGHKLVPIELIDPSTEEDQSTGKVKEENGDKTEYKESNSNSEVHINAEVAENSCRERVLVVDMNEEPKFEVSLESMELEEDENSLVFSAKECHFEIRAFGKCQESGAFQAMESIQEEEEDKNSDGLQVCEEVAQMPMNETEADVSIGTEIPDLDITDDIQNQENLSSYECSNEDPSISHVAIHEAHDHGVNAQVEEDTVEFRPFSRQDNERVVNEPSSLGLEVNEVDEEKVPDTPTSVDSLHHLHKKLLLLGRRDSGTEESLDGSITSELEGGDGVVTIEHLKSALRSERKALQALYTELEEERSASAVAANQTMAMINRLQEEKAAMQMEALQYQRMMEEQSEYDQEALQLLNELMVKREKEKQELEKELEIYRKKVLDYEAKEKRMLRKSKDESTRCGFSSASCSNAEDSDGLSIDLNQEAKEDDGFYSNQECSNNNTPADAVLNLEESLADFEEERLSILEQLKVLEEKLMTLDDDEEEKVYEDVRPMNGEENGYHDDETLHLNGGENGYVNGFGKGMNGKQRRTAGSKGKRLLPLFDATTDENGDMILNGNGHGVDSNGVRASLESNFELEEKKFLIEEEVDQLYERLQALEADREFLKHCISSLRKGDKGIVLLQEILQHLRELRHVELRVRNISDNAIM